MCSEKTEKNRLRRATPLPVDSQNSGSSGRQSSIHRPGRPGFVGGGRRSVAVRGCGGQRPCADGGGPWFPRRRPCGWFVFRFPHRRLTRRGEATAAGVLGRSRTGDDHRVTPGPEPGRALIESGAPDRRFDDRLGGHRRLRARRRRAAARRPLRRLPARRWPTTSPVARCPAGARPARVRRWRSPSSTASRCPAGTAGVRTDGFFTERAGGRVAARRGRRGRAAGRPGVRRRAPGAPPGLPARRGRLSPPTSTPHWPTARSRSRRAAELAAAGPAGRRRPPGARPAAADPAAGRAARLDGLGRRARTSPTCSAPACWTRRSPSPGPAVPLCPGSARPTCG